MACFCLARAPSSCSAGSANMGGEPDLAGNNREGKTAVTPAGVWVEREARICLSKPPKASSEWSISDKLGVRPSPFLRES